MSRYDGYEHTLNKSIFESKRAYDNFKNAFEQKLGQENWRQVYDIILNYERMFQALIGKEIEFYEVVYEEYIRNNGLNADEGLTGYLWSMVEQDMGEGLCDFNGAHYEHEYSFTQEFMAVETAIRNADNPSEKPLALNPVSVMQMELDDLRYNWDSRREASQYLAEKAISVALKVPVNKVAKFFDSVVQRYYELLQEYEEDDQDEDIKLAVQKKVAQLELPKVEEKAAKVQQVSLHDVDIDALIDEKFKNLIGMDQIKGKLKRIFKLMVKEKQLEKNGVDLSCVKRSPLNFMITGNPGVGKTTVAGIISKVLYQSGMIQSDKFVSCVAPDLKGQFIGHTSKKVHDIFKSAQGGVVFIDEAYALAGNNVTGDDSFANDAIAALMDELQKGESVVVFAGYKEPLEKFLKTNEGLKSRFPSSYRFDLDDYTTDELTQIFNLNIKNWHYEIEDGAIVKLQEVFKKASKVKGFGNARFVENTINELREIQAGRSDINDFKITENDVDDLIAKQEKDAIKERPKTGFLSGIER